MLKGIQKLINSTLGAPLRLLDNPKVGAFVKIGLIMYAGLVAPNPPNFLLKILKQPATKILVLTMIAYLGVRDPIIALLIAVAFMVSMMALHRIETTINVTQVLRGAVDIPQGLLQKTVDAAQDVLHKGGEMAGVPAVTGITNSIIDKAQSLTDMAIDTIQDAFLGKADEVQENFTMADRVINVEVPEIGNLDGLSGHSTENKNEFASPL